MRILALNNGLSNPVTAAQGGTGQTAYTTLTPPTWAAWKR